MGRENNERGYQPDDYLTTADGVYDNTTAGHQPSNDGGSSGNNPPDGGSSTSGNGGTTGIGKQD